MQVLILTLELVSEIFFFFFCIYYNLRRFCVLAVIYLDVVMIIISLQNKAEGMILSLLVLCLCIF
jgi:hypothetical protein